MSIKYYRLAKDEEPPEEFCAVRDVGGEPSEYVFYVPERENAKLREENQSIGLAAYELGRKSMAGENAKLRELARDVNKAAHMLCEAWEGSCSKEADGMSLYAVCPISDTNELCVFGKLHDRMRELGVVVE